MAISTKPPSGTRDFLPADVLARRKVIDTIRTCYEQAGFVPLETPTLERIEVLTGKYGEEGDQLMFKVLKRGEKLPALTPDTPAGELVDLALRYDLTVPLARVVAQYGGTLPRFFKRYQIQPVWRADRPQRGRFREFYQCDVDFVGTTSLVAEASVISAVTDALAALGFDDFTVHINDRRILAGIMEVAGVPTELEAAALVAVDKLDKIGVEGVRGELAEAGLGTETIQTLERLALGETLDFAHFGAAFADGASARGAEGVETLQTLFQLFETAPVAAGRLYFDPSLARGLSYYTGPIFEIRVSGLAGSIGGGGRYDGLVGMFKNQPVPAVGFSLGLERILVLLQEAGELGETGAKTDLYLLPLEAEATGMCLQAAALCRRAGLTAEVHPEGGKVGKLIAYAESLGARNVGLVGGNELAEQSVTIKNLATGEQQTVALGELAGFLAG